MINNKQIGLRKAYADKTVSKKRALDAIELIAQGLSADFHSLEIWEAVGSLFYEPTDILRPLTYAYRDRKGMLMPRRVSP